MAYRGDYTGALANQLRSADGKTDVRIMHDRAVREMGKQTKQTPLVAYTLRKNLILPGPQG